MPRAWTALFLFPLLAAPIAAESKNPADYPLRLHIFTAEETTFYHMRNVEESKGDGRADLYEGENVEGVDYTFDCADQLRTSFGYETYPAKWKKQDRELVVLMPKFGQAGTFWTCNLKTDVKPFAYTRHHGSMSSEPVADFKAWMVRHNYDPEHGKDTPTKTTADTPSSASDPTPPSH